MRNSVLLSVLSACVGGCIAVLFNIGEIEPGLQTSNIDVENAAVERQESARREPTRSQGDRQQQGKDRHEIHRLNEEVAKLKGLLEQANDQLLQLQEQIAQDNDIPSLEPELGLTARQEFRLTRLIEMSKDAPIQKHREAITNTGEISTLDGSDQTYMSLKDRHKTLDQNLKLAKREVLVRELGAERAAELAREALERRNMYAAAAKNEKQQRTMRSIFNRKNKLSAMLIDALSPDHH